jgi:hypothetical protein
VTERVQHAPRCPTNLERSVPRWCFGLHDSPLEEAGFELQVPLCESLPRGTDGLHDCSLERMRFEISITL